IKSVRSEMDKYHFGQASSILYDFVYDDFCSSYLEMSKIALSHEGKEADVTKDVLYTVMKDIILMIYPYTPFVTEEMYLSLPGHKKSIMEEPYPEYDRHLINKKAVEKLSILEGMIKDIRNYKSTNGMAPNAKVRLLVSPAEPFEGSGEYLKRFTFASSYEIKGESLGGSSFLYPGYELMVEEDVDPAILKEKLLKEKETLEFEISRSEKMLGNPGFVSKAPKEKVDLEKAKLEKNKGILESLKNKLASL
ncbi:MAG: class I tRNA ligase family protein, partial [Bacilli bacterium]|nr:class I tRNA ligase family protein [Bacilli bacterium]